MKMLQAALGFLGHDPFPDGGVLVFDMYTSTASVSISYLDKVDFAYTTRLNDLQEIKTDRLYLVFNYIEEGLKHQCVVILH